MLWHLGCRQLNPHPHLPLPGWITWEQAPPPLGASVPHLYKGLHRTPCSSGGPFHSVRSCRPGRCPAAARPRASGTCLHALNSVSSISVTGLGLAAGPIPRAALFISFPPGGPRGFPRVPLMGKLRPHEGRDLRLSQDKIQWFCKTRNKFHRPQKCAPSLVGPRAQPYPMVGTGRLGQAQAGDAHLGVNQEHLASTAGSDVTSAGVGGQPVGWPHGRVQAQTPPAEPSRPAQRWEPSISFSSPSPGAACCPIARTIAGSLLL